MFDDIRPYDDAEIPAAMRRIADNPLFPKVASFVFPDRRVEDVRDMMRSYDNIRDFQTGVMYEMNRRIIDDTTSGFSFGGVENIRGDDRHLFISNHRDIVLDASLLQNILVDNGISTCEITFGANLMRGEFVIDIGKSNKMFRVERPGGSASDFYYASKHLSEYIRMTITEKRESVWIAQRNGRTKDGIDRTDQGIIKMLGMSREGDRVKAVTELGILPVSVSYEWEPCDILKAVELHLRSKGPYEKKDGEDLNSIITGILQPKGRVHFEICKSLSSEDLIMFSSLPVNRFNREVASLIDRRICSSYHLWPNNYIAHDIRSGEALFAERYSQEQKERFLSHLSLVNDYSDMYDVGALRDIILGIYANPVDSLRLFSSEAGNTLLKKTDMVKRRYTWR